MNPENSDFLVKYSSTNVSGHSEVPRFVGIYILKKFKLLSVYLIIKCSRVQASTKQQFLEKLSKSLRHKLDLCTLCACDSSDSVNIKFGVKGTIVCLKSPGKHQNVATSQTSMF